MESMGETTKRKLSRGTTDEDQPATSGRKRCAQPLVDFLHENAERELRQQELDIKQKEEEKQQETIQAVMLPATAADESGFHISCQETA